jgi:FkbM family methyltransferase
VLARPARLASAITRLGESLARDASFLALPGLSLGDRLRLTYEKYAAYARALLGLPPVTAFSFCGRAYQVSTRTDAALLQRVLADTYECLQLFGLTGEPGLTAVDVGAHNGETAIAWATFLREPIIHSFEPDPVSHANAVANVGGIAAAVHGIGLSDHAGEAAFQTGRGSGGDATFALDRTAPDGGTPVPVARGDDVLAGVTPNLIKIDVEGYERHVVDGMPETLARCEFLTIEVSLRRPKDHRFHEIAQVLADHRFELIGAGQPHGPDGSKPTAIDLHFRRAVAAA